MKGYEYYQRNPTEQSYNPRETPLTDREVSLRETYEELVREDNNGKVRLVEADFSDIYTTQEIKADTESSKRIKMVSPEWRDQNERAQLLADFIAHEGSKRGSGFFSDCEIVPTAEYDDIHNGVDMVLEIRDGEHTIRLGVDATTSPDPEKLTRKYKKQEARLRKGTLSELKYFQSKTDSSIRGPITRLPTVILGVSSQYITDHAEELNVGFLKNKEPKERGSHEIATVMRNEILSQLEGQIYFLRNMRERNEKHEKSLQKLERAHTALTRIFKKENGATPISNAVKLNPTYQVLAGPSYRQ